jgi:hypothetical protein
MAPGVTVFQVTHPKPVSWTSLLLPIKKAIEDSSSSSQAVQIIPYADWISTLKRKSAECEIAEASDALTVASKNPAMKLLDFYESLKSQGEKGLRIRMDMANTLRSSKTLRSLEPIQNEWIAGWVKEWINV